MMFVVVLGGAFWLVSGSGRAATHDEGEMCLPVCHECAAVAGENRRSSKAPLAKHCVSSCRNCRDVKAASRRIDRLLVSLGSMEPG